MAEQRDACSGRCCMWYWCIIPNHNEKETQLRPIKPSPVHNRYNFFLNTENQINQKAIQCACSVKSFNATYGFGNMETNSSILTMYCVSVT